MPSINRQLFTDSPILRVSDVTLSATDDLQAHREKLARIVLGEMYQFVGLLDANGMTLEINQSALEGAGIQLDEIQGKPFWEARWWAVSKETQDYQRDCVLRARQGEFVQGEAEIYGQAAGEETIIIDFSLLPIKDQNGKIVFLLAEGRNITEIKQAEAEIARKNEELQKLLDKIRHLDELKSDFLANISHELRTPLALILGPTESILATGANLTELQRRDLGVIHRNAATLLKHVNDLLDLAKLDAGKMTVNYARVDLARAVRTIAAHFDALASQRSLSYVITTPDTLEAEVDPEKFDCILLNLLSNAFKFTPARGRIRCALELSGKDRLLLSVQDSGSGVPPEMHATIFDRFRQAQGGTTREFGGTGLGLAIAKGFVDLHGGTIVTLDAPGGGALFQVEIPLCAPQGTYVRYAEAPLAPGEDGVVVNCAIEELQRIADDASAQPRSPDRPLVLVAEDNAEMQRFIAEVLGGEYRVVAAADGAEALERALAEPPDLVVTDLMMPKLGGDRLVGEMRACPSLLHVPVLVLSAKADEALRLKLLSESVQDYVTKPFSPHELRARVRNLVMMKRARDALQKELSSQNEDLAQLSQQLIANKQALQQSLEAQQESEQLWRAVYEHSAAGIALTDLDGRILTANSAFQNMLGYTEKDLRNISLIQITPEDDRETSRSRITKLVAGKVNRYHVQRRYERRDGGIVWANAGVSLIPSTESRAPMLLQIVEDITERKRAEEKLAAAQNELVCVTRVTTMGELAASIAHEVNQPLAAVVANGHACLRWLAAETPNEQEVHDAVQLIIRDANRASDVISRIRGFLQRKGPHRTEVHLDEVIGNVISLVHDKARTHGVSLSVRSAADLPPVMADRVQLQQVVLNLVMNAIDAMSSVTEQPRILEVGVDRYRADAVLVAVRDSGVGLDPQHRDRIFDAFYTTKSEGMGMGLAISSSIIEAHGGRLWATPNEGPGETFQFTLPIGAPSES
ncbi:MAG: histidine kinase [Sutterellaceae bacterium]|nr:histidine kinase [Sutterellaceae bacterium]|tara:strand:- start:2693 stop:5626 length:2934 start_codon:yes stop_codon:yes gene_type:complete